MINKEIEPTCEKLDQIRKFLTDTERNAVEIAWQYWLENTDYISRKEYILRVKDRPYVEKLLKTDPRLIEQCNRSPGENRSGRALIKPTILGLFCLDNWENLLAAAVRLVEVASIVYKENLENPSVNPGNFEDDPHCPLIQLNEILHIAEIMTGWSIRIVKDNSWEIYIPDEIVDVTLGTYSAREYVLEMVSNEVIINNEIHTQLLINDTLWHIFFSADQLIRECIPGMIPKLIAILENLEIDNREHWSNAVHSMRRLLQMLADKVYPPERGYRTSSDGKSIAIGPENYINRIMCYVEDRSSSNRFIEIVGSSLEYLGNRLDAIFHAAQKGSHSEIYSREEAERYFIYTYLIIRDILSL